MADSLRLQTNATADLVAPRTRLALFLVLAPALLWLLGLIVLPHVDLAVLSLRTRVAPRTYELGFGNYRTFIDEPLYWHTFVRTAVMSIFAGPLVKTAELMVACALVDCVCHPAGARQRNAWSAAEYFV